MRIKSIISLLVLVFLTSLMVGLISFPASAEEDGGRIIQISTSGYDIANSVSFSPTGEYLAVGTTSGIRIFDSKTYSERHYISTKVWARSVVFSADGQWLVSGLFDRTARLWDVNNWNLIHTFSGPAQWVRSVAFSLDGKLLATCADDDKIRLWNVSDGSLRWMVDNLEGSRVVAIAPGGETLAVGLKNGSIVLLSILDGSLVKTLVGHTDWVRSLAFSPDGTILASGAFDATIRLWDIQSGRETFILTGHQSSVLGLAFSPNGHMLASGSVDSTVKLWDPENGSLLRTLIGHTGFVYSVAFSPDGGSLASGAGDNTVRIWDMEPAGIGIDEVEQPQTPSDCRVCHHPAGQSVASKVIQVRCDACHADGAGLNFCLILPRDARAVTPPLASAGWNLDSGVPVASKNLAIVIDYPTNGETLYTQGQYQGFLSVSGRVYYQGSKDNVMVELLAYSDDTEEPILTLSTQPEQSGRFTFRLQLNPGHPMPVFPNSSRMLSCEGCHDSSRIQGALPNGAIRLQVKATTQDEQAWDERRFQIDASGFAQVEVEVIEKESGEALAGLPVQADTILFDWRARYAMQISDEKGVAHLSLEALSQSSTLYKISVPSTLIEGYFYESIEPANLLLPAGTTKLEPVTVYVSKKSTRIDGRLTGAGLLGSWRVWAIHLPDGAFHTVLATPEGLFSFQEVPSGEYILVASPLTPRNPNTQVEPARVDVTEDNQSEIILQSKPTGVFVGRVLSIENRPIPFAWIKSASGPASWSDPVSGEIRVYGSEGTTVPIEIWAPGYYSQAHVVDLSATSVDSKDFILVAQPDTNMPPWGEGRLVIPLDTYYEVNTDGLTLSKGWVWGENPEATLLEISAGSAQIMIMQGSFTVEYLPQYGGWLYLSDGEAVVRSRDGRELTVKKGELITFFQDTIGEPVTYEPVVLSALRDSRAPLIEPVWQPSLSAQMRDRLARAGIDTAQIMTFITYLMALLTLLVSPIIIIKLASKGKKEKTNE